MKDIDTTVRVQQLEYPLFAEKEIKVFVLRLDEIHPILSGNKIFKLHYFLQACLQEPQKRLITFGGAFSNHLAATAYAAFKLDIHSTGIVRGEKPSRLSPTLQLCAEYGMELQFVSRNEFANLKYAFPSISGAVIIPEGGFHPMGAKGASLIMQQISPLQATHVITAVGTATTLAGLLLGKHSENIIGVPVIKNMTDIPNRLKELSVPETSQPDIWNNYHFGGYAKHSPDLISFINDFYNRFLIPLDFVYTAKMMFGVMEKIKAGYFNKGSIVVCIHTGGLQGNISIGNQLHF